MSHTGTNINQFLPANVRAGLVNTPTPPSAANYYVTLVDLASVTTLYTGNGVIGAGRIATQGGDVVFRQTNTVSEFIIDNQAVGDANLSVVSGLAAAGNAVVLLDAQAANMDAYIHFASAGTPEITMGWDESAARYKMGTSSLTTSTWFEYEPSTPQGRLANNLGIGTTMPGTARRLLVRGIGSTSATYSIVVWNSGAVPMFGVRDDGLSQFNTIAPFLSGVGGAYTVRSLIADWTSNSTGATIETAVGGRLISNPSADSTVRASGGRFTNTKTGSFVIREIIGVVGEALNTGNGNITHASGIAGLMGGVFHARSQYNGDVTINTMWGVEAKASIVNSSGGTTVTVTDFGGLEVGLEGTQNCTITNMYGVKVNAPAGNLGGEVVTNTYGLHLSANTLGINNFGVYQLGATIDNIFQGDIVVGALAPTGNGSLVEINGDLEIVGTNQGLILEDRTTGIRYRIYYDNGALQDEAA